MTRPDLRLVDAPKRRPLIFGRALSRLLLERASELTAIPTRELMSLCRKRDTAWTRFAVMLVANESGKSLSQIADFFGFLDHTSILHGIRRARELERREPEFTALIRLLRLEAANAECVRLRGGEASA